jgi:hypothetical protein
MTDLAERPGPALSKRRRAAAARSGRPVIAAPDSGDEPTPGRSRDLAAVALLVLLLGVFFWKAVFLGYVLTPADQIFSYAFFREGAPAQFQHPSNPLLTDPVEKFYPWHLVVREALQRGELPFWNPYIYAGAPLFANAESAILYPINLVGYLLPLPQALTLSAVTRLFVAAWGAFLFARALRLGRVGAAVSSLTFAFSGSMVVWLNYPIGNALAWAPMQFYAGEKLLATRDPRYAALLSLVLGTQILGGHYQTTFIVLLAWGAYCLFRLEQLCRWPIGGRGLAAAAGLVATGTAAGFMLAAVQLVPFWEWLQLGNEMHIRIAERASAPVFKLSSLVSLVDVVTFVMPHLFGNPTWGSSMSFVHSNYIEVMGYAGILPLVFAGLAVAASRSSVGRDGLAPGGTALVRFFAVLGLVFLILSFRLPGLTLIERLPVFSLVSGERYRLVYTLCLAVLAGFGADYAARQAPGGRGWTWLQRGALALAGLGFALFAAGHGLVYGLTALLERYNRLRVLRPILLEAFALDNVVMYMPVIVALAAAVVVALHRRGTVGRSVCLSAVGALVVLDLFAFGMDFNPAIPPEQVFPQTPPATALRALLDRPEPARVVAMNDDMPPSTGSPYRFQEIAGSDFPSRRYAELALRAGGTMASHFRIAFPTLQPRLTDLMNVRYVISSAEPAPLPPARGREVYRDSSLRIFENQDALPRAFAVHRARVIADDQAILDTLTADDFDPRAEVVLERPPAAALSGQARSDDRVDLVDYRGGSVLLRATLGQPGLVFLGDSYYPGWRAYVDGRETPIYRANYAFRAVEVPAGEHEVRFAYAPTALTLGIAGSLAGIALTGGLAAAAWILRRRGRQPDLPR